MKKHVFGRKLKRDTNERKALFKNLLTSLVLNDRIETTEAKAKAIRAAADKLITKAKKGGITAKRALEADVHAPAVVKLIDDLAGRFTKRQGGYTRIIKSGKRVADNAAMVIMEWVEKAEVKEKSEKKTEKKEAKPKKEVKKKPARIATQSVAGGEIKPVKKTVVKKTEKKAKK